MQRYLDEGEAPPLPESPLPYLTDLLFEIGPAMPGGFGMAPLSEGEIESWQFNQRTRLSAWEAKTIRLLSRDYVGETVRAEAQDAPPPYVDDDVEMMRARVASKVEDFFG